jgi:hypothetical protein
MSPLRMKMLAKPTAQPGLASEMVVSIRQCLRWPNVGCIQLPLGGEAMPRSEPSSVARLEGQDPPQRMVEPLPCPLVRKHLARKALKR